MSVSIALLPVALALRLVMGKENFNSWVTSQEIRVATRFQNELSLNRAVKKAGYDVIKYGTLLKTHFGATFLIWENVDGEWIAVFSKLDDIDAINAFMADVESVANEPVFITPLQSGVDNDAAYPTNFYDGATLFKTLSDFAANPAWRSSNEITCEIEGIKLLFFQEGDALYKVKIGNPVNLEAAYRYLSDIDEEYKKQVQTASYQKIRQNIASRNLVIEREEVLADKTIVITLNVSH